MAKDSEKKTHYCRKLIMNIIYSHEKIPEKIQPSIMLCGPTPRSQEVKSWRPEAVKLLEKQGFSGLVLIPEPRDGIWTKDYIGQIDWENRALKYSTCLLFWIPRNLDTLPGFTTNIEFGMYKDSGKIVLGYPKNTPKMRYLDWHAKNANIHVTNSLDDVVSKAIEKSEYNYHIKDLNYRLDSKLKI